MMFWTKTWLGMSICRLRQLYGAFKWNIRDEGTQRSVETLMSRDITACHVTGRCLWRHDDVVRALGSSFVSIADATAARALINRSGRHRGRARGMPGEQWRPEIVADEWQIEMIIDCSADRPARSNLGALCTAEHAHWLLLMNALQNNKTENQPTAILTTWPPSRDWWQIQYCWQKCWTSQSNGTQFIMLAP